MPKRNPTGMSWEEHRQLGCTLKRLEASAGASQRDDHHSPFWNLTSTLSNMRHELDEYLAKDCPEHASAERHNVYYGRSDMAKRSGRSARA
ncbi:MAG: hypothetical protein FWD79_04435 [Desulfobulbus sp.]|nr:hypothetical protein [Desulfobulbus sp.]